MSMITRKLAQLVATNQPSLMFVKAMYRDSVLSTNVEIDIIFDEDVYL